MECDVSCSESSAQARSYRNKPPHLLAGARLIDLLPMSTTKPFAIECFHPVPIDLGEVRKLCQIDGSARIRRFELIGQTCRISAPRLTSRYPKPCPAFGVTAPSAVGHLVQGVSAVVSRELRPPKFELLRPSVVIRRRPKH